MKKSLYIVCSICFMTLLSSCNPEPKRPEKPKKNPVVDQQPIKVNFNADSAFYYVQKQVSFGPRIPRTTGHSNTADWLLAQLQQFADTAYFQIGTATLIDGSKRVVKNIIAEFNPDAGYTTLLAAHWDTRPQADEDPKNPRKAADGANDGGSGVGVLLEVARQLKEMGYRKGVDIVFFDQEDGGKRRGDSRTWCVGSQFWGDNAAKTGYRANQGILLDMVGAADATFGFEKNSMNYNPGLMRRIWKTGQSLGYGRYFINVTGGQITDDHIYMTEFAGIPTIDIIHYNTYSKTGFPEHWHTLNDNMDVISKPTLNAVGHTVLHYLAEIEKE